MLRTYGQRTFDFSRRVAVMAILNRTPDSFYDRGATFGFEAAVAAGDRALAEGADWLDVGGVKAGPGAPVDEDEELDRVVPLVEALRERSDAVISVDTFRPGVARQALAAGADVVNDPSGLHDPRVAEVAAEAGAGLVVMHTGGPPRTRPHRPAYGDVVGETLDVPLDQRLEGSLAAAALSVAAGANIVRVHDVQASVRVVRMTEAILGRRLPAATRRGLA
jgi:dihydropteroate synthase